jgi:hypothetical protein
MIHKVFQQSSTWYMSFWSLYLLRDQWMWLCWRMEETTIYYYLWSNSLIRYCWSLILYALPNKRSICQLLLLTFFSRILIRKCVRNQKQSLIEWMNGGDYTYVYRNSKYFVCCLFVFDESSRISSSRGWMKETSSYERRNFVDDESWELLIHSVSQYKLKKIFFSGKPQPPINESLNKHPNIPIGRLIFGPSNP